jgi:hypothetical protein
MDKGFILSDFNEIKQTSPETAKLLIDVCILSVTELYESLNSPKNVDDKLIKDLSEEQRTEMGKFYSDLLELFLENEYYEYCQSLAFILEKLEYSGE